MRRSMLRYLDANAGGRFGLSVAVIHQLLRAEGMDVRLKGVEAELGYLRDKGLIATLDKAISPEIALWRITALGRDEFAR